ncbi:MAG: TetR/AcrR family transcriptional regulator [Wenzhouxiangellaceae bacterium]|nr:TetR/AcrR family transcriptional regulator [Wenzhouxiangellaceae bacterium]
MVNTNPGRPSDPAKDRKILAAGRELLFGQGPVAVTMEAVAKKAGVAKPTLYRRYANRDELLAAVAEAEAERMAGRFRIEPDTAGDLKRALVEFAGDLTRFLLSAEHIRFIHALGASSGMAQSIRDSIYRHGPLNTRDRLADWLRGADQRGLLACPEPDGSAEMFLGMLMGLDLVRTLYHVEPTRDLAARAAYVESIVEGFLKLHRPGN